MAVKFLGEYFSEGIAKIKGANCRGISFFSGAKGIRFPFLLASGIVRKSTKHQKSRSGDF
jgi:hypothetical protein